MKEQPRDLETESRFRALKGAPDRRDWEDVRRRAERSPRRRLAWFARPLRFVALGGALAGLAAILAVILVRTPDHPRRSSSDATPTYVPQRNLVPGDIPSALRFLGAGVALTPVLGAPTFSGPVTAYRAIAPDGSYETYFVATRELAGADCPTVDGAPVPTDPPGSPARVTIPDLNGLPVEQAAARLQAIGLVPRPTSPDDARRVPRWGTSMYAGGQVPLGAAGSVVTNWPGPEEVATFRHCVAAGPPQGRWIAAAVAPEVRSAETTWSNGNVIDGTVGAGLAILPLPNSDTCVHPETLRSVVFRDAAGAPLVTVATGEPRLAPFVDAWGPRIPHRCVRSTGRPAPFISLVDDPAAQTHADQLPPGLDDPLAWPVPIHRDSVRAVDPSIVAGRYGAVTVAVVGTADRERTCINVAGSGVTGGANCVSREVVSDGGLMTRMQHSREGDPIVLAGVVPDGVTRVVAGGVTSRIVRNVYVLVVPAGTQRPERLTLFGTNPSTLAIPRTVWP